MWRLFQPGGEIILEGPNSSFLVPTRSSKEMKPGSSQWCMAGEDDKTDINPSMEGRFRLEINQQ